MKRSPRRVPDWAGLALLVAILATGVYAARDVMQYFRCYVAADKRAGFDSELADLRAAIDAQAGPNERIVISPGGITRAPSLVLFYYARRNGFAAADDSPTDFLDRARARGARLLLRYDAPGANRVPLPPGRIVAEGPWWRLSCIAADGCERRAQ